jgi:hypothetical protein
MNKMIFAVVAAAALAAGGVALAQAECQGNGTCSDMRNSPLPDLNGHDYGYGPGVWPPGSGAVYDPATRKYYSQQQIIEQQQQQQRQLGNAGMPQYRYQYRTPYARTERDRDGDGIRNNRDRYPDDPRYR